MTVTLGDGKALTYSVMATLQVVEPDKALNAVSEWPETAMETVSGLLGELLADETEDRFKSSYGRRAKLLKELLDKINAETLAFGVRVTALRFSNCVVNVRTYRLLMDRSTFSDATIGAV